MSTDNRAKKRIALHIENLNSPDHDTRCRAERYLLRYHVLRAADQLLDVVDHPNPYVRLYAAWVLAHTHDSRAFEPILRLCDDLDEQVRYDATIALGILDDPRAIEPLKRTYLENDYTRPAGDAFSRMGVKIVPVLAEILKQGAPDVRLSVTQVVGNFAADHGDKRCIEMLQACLNDVDAQVRENAESWCNEIGLTREETSVR